MNKATPIGQLPYLPPQGPNDPRVVNTVMNDMNNGIPVQSSGSNNTSNLLSDPMIKDSIVVLVLYVLVNTDFVNGLLLQNLPGIVEVSQPHLQTVGLKAIAVGVALYIIRKFLM